VFVVLIACPLAKPCEAGGSSWGFNRTNSRSYLAQKGSVIKLDINLKVFSYKKGNYPGCQVQGSLFRGSTRTIVHAESPQLAQEKPGFNGTKLKKQPLNREPGTLNLSSYQKSLIK